MTTATTGHPLACNLKAIDSTSRSRYNELVKRLRSAMRQREETPAGYQYELDSAKISIPETAEWIAMERLCCPFLTLQISAAGNQPNWLLTLFGPEGVKPLLDAEFSQAS